ncbi:MAG: hypothetical protein DWQ19_09420 [Crenarchaeota archaeon]|nr:MAG: hypothetical protein DWQ19_09420 [Thermoproteota archaeon]
MLVFPSMLVSPAERAGIKVPVNLDSFDKNAFPYFFVYCRMQVGAPMPTPPSAHWDNANVIASIPLEKIKSITAQEIYDMGFKVGHSK